jgi:outer membrane receptor for monomeric catechols
VALLQDALRNVPGITLNAGEGGSHGDSVNLRGLFIPDSFFLDGVRDLGQYQRDTFNTDAVSVRLRRSSAAARKMGRPDEAAAWFERAAKGATPAVRAAVIAAQTALS